MARLTICRMSFICAELKKHYPHIFEDEKYTNGDLVYDFTR